MKGMHGTRKQFAESIAREGKVRPSQGIRGTGAYFWDYDDGSKASAEHAEELAILSWRRKFGATSKQTKDNSCSVVYFDFSDEVDECLDLCQGSEYYLDVLEYLREARDRIDRAANKEERNIALNAVYEDLAIETEKSLGKPIRLIRHTVKLTQKHYPIVYLTGDPTCLISRYEDVGKFENVKHFPSTPFKLD